MSSSVRERLERKSREAPEVVVPTSNRRVALTGGPTLSVRQQADFAASQNEVTVRPTERTSAASVEFEIGGFVRVRDRQAAQQSALEPERPQTAAEIEEARQQRWNESVAQERQRQEQLRIEAQKKRDEGVAKSIKAMHDAADARRAEDDARKTAAGAASLKAMYLLEGATPVEQSVVDNLMRREGKYGDVHAHLAKLTNLRWTLGEQEEA